MVFSYATIVLRSTETSPALIVKKFPFFERLVSRGSDYTNAPPSLVTLAANAQMIGQFTNGSVVLFFVDAEGRCTEGFRILHRRELTIVHQDELIQYEQGHLLQLHHEKRMNVNLESIFRPFGIGKWVRELALQQAGSIENDFTWMPDQGTIF